MAIEAREQLAVFLRDVKDNPDDDTPRLVLADWLQDQGDARGEFVAVSVRRHRLAEDDPCYHALWRRERRLLSEHAFEWLGPLVDVSGNWRFQRGFIHLEGRADRLLTPEVEALAEAGAFGWVESLRLTEVSLPGMRMLRRSELPGAASCLDLSESAFGDEGLLQLLRSERLSGLRRLELRRCRVGEAGARALASCPQLAGLKRLDLRGNRLGVEAIEALRERFGECALVGGLIESEPGA